MTQFSVKELNDIISDLLLNVFNNTPDVTDANIGGVLRQMLEAVAQEISLLYESLQTIYDGSRVDYAIGTDLEQIGAIVGITRKTGTQAEGNVSFMRNTPAPSDFTIAASSIVSTQPNTAEEQLRFLVVNNTVYSATITGEAHRFRDGIYDYPMDERIISTISQLQADVLAVPTNLTDGVDFQIVKDATDIRIEDASTLVILDSCEVANWTQSADAAAEVLDAANFREGLNSLSLGKTGVVTDTASYETILGAVKDGSDADLHLWLYIDDAPTLAVLKQIEITYGSGGSAANSFKLVFDDTDLATGWQILRIDRDDIDLIQTGFPSITAINFLKIALVTNNIGDTFASGKVKMDFWRFTADSEYNGDYVQFLVAGTQPDDDTDYTVNYVPLSKEVLCRAEAVGVKYNVSKRKIVFKVSNIPNVLNILNYVAMGGGVDLETDEELRTRIKEGSLSGEATANALRQAVLAVNGVTSVTVDDLPQKSAANEAHRFVTPTLVYKLDFEIALDNATLYIDGTAGSVPFIFTKGVDYVLTATNEIQWLGTGTNPDNNTDFFVDYDYEWLGHVEMFVSGVQTPLPPTVLTAVQDAVAETKAAGVDVDIIEPTVVSVNVTATVTVESGYDVAATKLLVEDNLRTYLNGLGVDDDVYVSELIRVIQDTEGVQNSTVTIPAADVTIATNQIAKAGTIAIS